MTDEIVQKVREIVAEESCTPLENTVMSTTFVELGVDSLDFLQIIHRVRYEVGQVDDVFIGSIETVEQLCLAVGAKCEKV